MVCWIFKVIRLQIIRLYANCTHGVLSYVQNFTESKKNNNNNCPRCSTLRLSVFLMSSEQDESAFLFFYEFNTITWITVPPVFNCPNEQGLNYHPWDYSQSVFSSKPTQSSVSLCLTVQSHNIGDVWEADRCFLPTSFPAAEQARIGLIFSLTWDSILHNQKVSI